MLRLGDITTNSYPDTIDIMIFNICRLLLLEAKQSCYAELESLVNLENNNTVFSYRHFLLLSYRTALTDTGLMKCV